MTEAWEATAALVDPVRRRLYEYVRAQARPVTREEAARAAEVSRGLAAFHLDKLVEVGLLTAGYGRGPGTPRRPGRSPKVYRPSDVDFSLTIPERRYDVLGEILVEAVSQDPHDAAATAERIAHEHGVEIGRAAGLTGVLGVLADLGFEPHEGSGRIRLANCPFHRLAVKAPRLVCGLNQRFLAGMLHGVGGAPYQAVLAPRPGACCVELRP